MAATTSYRQRPARFDIELCAGEDLDALPIDVTLDGEDYPFTGAVLAAYVYSQSDIETEQVDPTPLATLTVTSPADGQVLLSCSDTITETTLGPGLFYWACESTVAGITRIVVAGKFNVRPKRS